MEHLEIVAEAADAGRTVQRLLHDRAGLAHSRARGVVVARLVRRNGRVVEDPAERVDAGDRIEISHDPTSRYPSPRRPRREEGYRVVHEEREFVVVDKDPGLITVPAPAHAGESLVEKLALRLRKRGFREPRMLAVHRIDRFTSGLVVVARPGPAFESLRAQFASGSPERVYLAVADGRVEADSGTLVHHLAEHPRSLKVHEVPPSHGGRRASSTYRVLERFDHATLLEVRLETGRRNQIRVQLAAIGHPLVGDVAYGRRSPLIERTALHACRLSFAHPSKGARIQLEAEPPGDLRRLLAALRRGARP